MNHLHRALSKVERFHKHTWVGYLLPNEILALIEDGAQPSEASSDIIKLSKDSLHKGQMNSRWFYFTLGKTKP